MVRVCKESTFEEGDRDQGQATAAVFEGEVEGKAPAFTTRHHKVPAQE